MISQVQLLLDQLKALGHPNRLTMVGLLSQSRYTVEELAIMLELTPPTVSHHLSILSSVDLVQASAQGYYNLYTLNSTALQQLGEALTDLEALELFGEGIDRSAYPKAVITAFLDQPHNHRTLPGPPRKRSVVLDHIAHTIPAGQKHTLDEVEDRLTDFVRDPGALLEELLSTGRVTYYDNGYWTGHVEQTADSGLGIWD